MNEITLTLQQVFTILGGAFVLVSAIVGGVWKFMNGHVKHWQDRYNTAAKELSAANQQLEAAKWKMSELVPQGQIQKPDELPGSFTKLVSAYQNADLELNETQRIRRKDALASKLGGYAIGRGIPRAVLVKSRDPGCAVALCQKIADDPQIGDSMLLKNIATYPASPHARHQMFAAIHALARSNSLGNQNDLKELLGVLDRLETELKKDKAADVHIREINRARTAIQSSS